MPNTPPSTKKAPRIRRKRERQTRYLSQAIQLEEAVNPHIIRSTMSIVSLSVLAFILWSAFTNINEVARTSGEVVPNGYQQTVQHLEGGMIKSIRVEEGDIVEKGEILLTLSDSILREDLEQAQSKQHSLLLHGERLRAFVENREPDFLKDTNASPDELKEQQQFFESMRNARTQEQQLIKVQLEEQEHSIQALRQELKIMRDNSHISNEKFRRHTQLNSKGFFSDIRLLEEKQLKNNLKADIKRTENQILLGQKEYKELQDRKTSLIARHHDEAYERLSIIAAEKAQNIELIQKIEEQIKRLTVRSPSRGLVKGLAVNTIGAVIQSGQTLMEIVPLGQQLVVQVKIEPKDVGHLQVGQPVQLMFSSYDFSRYGSMQGELEHISATTFSGQAGERYYQGRISLSQTHIGSNAKNLILPGMTVMADIITGDKTILQYLLKPIHLSLQSAFTER